MPAKFSKELRMGDALEVRYAAGIVATLSRLLLTLVET